MKEDPCQISVLVLLKTDKARIFDGLALFWLLIHIRRKFAEISGNCQPLSADRTRQSEFEIARELTKFRESSQTWRV